MQGSRLRQFFETAQGFLYIVCATCKFASVCFLFLFIYIYFIFLFVCFHVEKQGESESTSVCVGGKGLGVISQLLRSRHLHLLAFLAVVASDVTAQSTTAKQTTDPFFSPAPGSLRQQIAEIADRKSDVSDSAEATVAKRPENNVPDRKTEGTYTAHCNFCKLSINYQSICQ